jgi:hypothetical protein
MELAIQVLILNICGAEPFQKLFDNDFEVICGSALS